MSMNITQSLRKYKYSLTLAAALLPLEIPFPMRGSGPPWEDLDPPSSTWFLEPTQACSPNGISIGSAVFAELATD